MDPVSPLAGRPAEHLLRAHLAHSTHLAELEPERERQIRDMISHVSKRPEPPKAPARAPKRRAKK